MSTTTLIIGCYLIAMVFGFFILKPEKKKPERIKPVNDYDAMFVILDNIVQRELMNKYSEYKMKDIRVIYDFERDMRELTNRIMGSLSETFLDDFGYYHDRQYIIKYVARSVQTFLIEYTKANKIKTK